jgi:ABC-type ATPase with predicted acetyltransferase domain
MEPIGRCPFCKEDEVDMEHVSVCSMSDLKTRRFENESQLGPSEKLSKIAALTKKYAEATAQEKEQLWVCRDCYHFGEADKTPVVCLCCGTAFIVSASTFMEKLGR